MKQEIVDALKTAYATLGLSDEAFDGVASLLEKTVTEESQIATAIAGDDVKGLLKTIQGQVDSWKNKFHDKDKELKAYQTAHPDTKPSDPPADPNDPVQKKLAELEAKQKEYDAKIKATEAKARNAEVVSELHRLLKEKGADNDFIRNMTLRGIEIGENDTAESLVEKYKTEYDKNFKEAYGDGPAPKTGVQTPTEYQAGAYASEVERLRAEGKLPKAE